MTKTRQTHQETESLRSTSLCNSMVSHALRLKNLNNYTKNKKQQVKVKNSEKSILRMSIGRKNREYSNEFKDRGYPKNIENWTSYTQKQKQSVVENNKKLKGYAYKKVTLK